MTWHGKVRRGLLLLLWSFVVISETMAKELYRYDTAYACEGKTLKIECREGELIKLIRANYGRFSIAICNDHGNTDWSVNCMSPKSLRVLHSRCSQNQNCSIPASTSMFGDPCPGTHKYLEAHYQCLPATTTTTTNRPSPPWLITSQPPMWSTAKPTARPSPLPPKLTGIPSFKPSSINSTTSSSTIPISESLPDGERTKYTKDTFNPIPSEITTLPFTTFLPKKISLETTISNTYIPSPSVLPFWTRESEITDYCSPVTKRTIYWNWTRINENNIQPCPGGTTGFAKWRCIRIDTIPTWSPQTPDLSACRSVWLTSLEQRILIGRDPLVSITNDLAQVTSSKTLYGGDMMITTKIIKTMTRKMSQDIQTFPDPRQREAIVAEMLNDVVKTSSNLLDSSQHPSWRDLSYEEQMRVATSLLIGLEENAFLLADTVMREKTVDQVVKNIMLSVRVLQTKSVTTEKFPSENNWEASNDSIELPQGALLDNSDGGLVRLVFIAFDRLEEILQWHPDTSDTNSNKNVTKILNSKVICASLGKGRHIQLKEPVRLTFKHIQTENVTNPSCVFWDYSMNAWSKEGCYIEITNNSHTICYCNHLTNFAILMDVEAIYLPIAHQIALQIITYVGCIISIICLVLAIVTFQMFRGLKCDRTTIHCNLCFCLLIAELLFVTGIGQTENKIVCSIIAGFLQFFFLCAFAWMFFEGFQLYVMLVEVFEPEKSRIRWYYVFAYGIPTGIVLISALIYPQGYGTDNFCWLKTNNYFIYSFVAPVIVVLALNVIFLTLAIVKMCQHANTSVSIKNKEHSRLASTSGKEENALQPKFQANLAWLKGAVVLIFLLGLTWTFGFLYVSRETVAMAYIFATLNSLQGFFIFLFHCVQNEKVRKEYRKFIRRHSWLPKCLHCSKSNTGVSSSSGTSGSGKERRTNLYAGSNGNPSGSHSHSTDNSVLSPHGTSNTSSKSYSRDSGHGGSEQEDSPRSQIVLTDTRLNNAKDVNRQAYITAEGNQAVSNNIQQSNYSDYSHRHDIIHLPKHSYQAQQAILPHTSRRKNGNMGKSTHWNQQHTYSEIFDGRLPRYSVDDPVYEEIERNEIQVSDLSDEDVKRQSDMSRQSSRSYGDSKPLITHSPGSDRNIVETTAKHISRDINRYITGNETCRMMPPNSFRGDTARSLAAVLDGKIVVCHLEPPEMYHRDYVTRTVNVPPYSES